MAEKQDEQKKEDVLLIAEVRAHFLDGATVELLPFKDEEDVRGAVNKFIEDWSKTGFLLKENFMYPWHQVKSVEVLSVKSMTHAEAQPYLDDWEQDTEAQKVFWKTRKTKGKEEPKGGGAAPGH